MNDSYDAASQRLLERVRQDPLGRLMIRIGSVIGVFRFLLRGLVNTWTVLIRIPLLLIFFPWLGLASFDGPVSMVIAVLVAEIGTIVAGLSAILICMLLIKLATGRTDLLSQLNRELGAQRAVMFDHAFDCMARTTAILLLSLIPGAHVNPFAAVPIALTMTGVTWLFDALKERTKSKS